ncbi:MAG: type II secretion system protein GspH, partial [Betaproteobacteria bacterium]
VDAWPTQWLHPGVQAEVIGAPRLVLGPEPLLPPQRVRLRLAGQELVLASDGLGGFRLEDRR